MKQSRRIFLQQTGAIAAVVFGPDTLRRSLTETTADSAGTITLVQNGQSSYGIVVLPGAPPAAQYGAQELQSHILAMSGAKLPIIANTDVTQGNLPPVVLPSHFITVGPPANKSPLGEEEFLIQTNSPTLSITGGGLRGTLYGCYALLDDVLGIRWFTQTITRIPYRPTITFNAFTLHDRPAYEYREPYWAEALQPQWAVRNRGNGNFVKIDPSMGGHISYGLFVHTLFTLVPPSQYFASHPEYFSIFNGRRVPDQQLCLTNSDIADIAANTLRHLIPTNPDARLWSVSQMDTGHYCQCGPCHAAAQEYGAPSGTLLNFVNAVAEKIEPEYPHILIDTLAYNWSEQPPRNIRPRANVRVRYAAGEACTAHGWDQCNNNAGVYQRFKGWTKLTSNLYIWLYGTNFLRYLQPIPNIDETWYDIALLHRMGACGVFHEGAYTGPGAALSELKVYLLAKLLWNPNQNPQTLITEFLNGVYGSGAPYLQQWIDIQEQEVRLTNGGKGLHAGHFDPPTAPYLPDSLITTGTTLFDSAERVTANDPTALAEVQKARLSLEFLQWSRSTPGTSQYDQLSRTVADKIQRFKIIQVGEGKPANALIKPLAPALHKT